MNKNNIITIIVIALVITGVILVKNAKQTNPDRGSSGENINITKETINEENYTGTKVTITGEGKLADTARAYVNKAVSDFAVQANAEVPDRRKQFGDDAPPAHYTIDLNAKYIKTLDTESIVLDSYVYTGGANGMSSYQVFTARRSDGEIIPITTLIPLGKQDDFVDLVKADLLEWQPDGTETPVVFADQIKDLTIDSFANYSLDDDNMTIYFDKYVIGPGALGAVPFNLSRSEVINFININ